MPLYVMETSGMARSRIDGAVSLAVRRFPEVVVEAPPRTDAGRTMWVCRAPSASHLARWAISAQLVLAAVRRLTEGHGPGERGDP